MSMPTTLFFSLLLACSLQACTSQQLYQATQASRQNECNKLVDRAEHDRCMQAANKEYDQYHKEVNSIQ